MSSLVFSQIEREVIVLKAVMDMVGDMVNREVFVFYENQEGTEARFNSMTHCKYFNIMMADFLSYPDIIKIKKSYVDVLIDIGDKPSFDNVIGSTLISKEAKTFKDWLDDEMLIERMWFPSIDTKDRDGELNFKIKRKDFVSISANIIKHNFNKQNKQAILLKDILEENNRIVSLEEALIALEDFYNWSHGDGELFNFIGGRIAEFLHNIRWAIYEYLLPEYKRAHEFIDEQRLAYRFKFPLGVEFEITQKYYWDLMNDIRHGMYLKRFVVPDYMKTRY